MKHPAEQDLALYAGGDHGFVESWILGRHVRNCASCSEVVEEYRELTLALSAEALSTEADLPDWDSLAGEMRANIRVGLEAGACIPRERVLPKPFALNPRLTVALASLMVLVGAGVFLRQPKRTPSGAVIASHQMASEQRVQVDTEGVTITSVFGE